MCLEPYACGNIMQPTSWSNLSTKFAWIFQIQEIKHFFACLGLTPLKQKYLSKRYKSHAFINEGCNKTQQWGDDSLWYYDTEYQVKDQSKWRDNRNEQKTLAFIACFSDSLVVRMYCFPHRLYNVNIYLSCITVLGAHFLCWCLHL